MDKRRERKRKIQLIMNRNILLQFYSLIDEELCSWKLEPVFIIRSIYSQRQLRLYFAKLKMEVTLTSIMIENKFLRNGFWFDFSYLYHFFAPLISQLTEEILIISRLFREKFRGRNVVWFDRQELRRVNICFFYLQLCCCSRIYKWSVYRTTRMLING